MASEVNINGAQLRREFAQANQALTSQEQNTTALGFLKKKWVRQQVLDKCIIHGALTGALSALAAAVATLWIAPPLVPKAAIAAGAVGFAVGSVSSFTYQAVKIKQSDIFKNWVLQKKANKLYPLFERYIENRIPNDLRCPYTLSIISVPVQAHEGHVMERDEVMKDLARGNGTVACLHCTRSFTEKDLSYAAAYHRNVLALLRPIFQEVVDNPVLIEGVQAYEKQAAEQSSNMMQGELDVDFQAVLFCKNDKEREGMIEKVKEKTAALAKKYKIS